MNRLSDRLADHPTVQAVWARRAVQASRVPDVIDADRLRTLCLEAAGHDSG